MKHSRLQKALYLLLLPFSWVYAAIMRRRAAAYARQPAKSARPGAFCISVGNIAWGGSGKTPLVDWLLELARQKGQRATVLTRGYGGKSATRPLPVTAQTNAAQSGDEPLMLALAHPEAQILADPLRRRALAWAEQNSPANLYILDDGMQHLAIQRDLNLVLLRRDDLLDQWNRVIPAGSWRESAQALHRADAFLLRAAPDDFTALEDCARRRLQGYAKPLFSFDLQPQCLVPLEQWRQQPKAPSKLPPKALVDSLVEPLPEQLPKTAAAEQTGVAATSTTGATSTAGTTSATALPGTWPKLYNLCTAVGSPASVLRSAQELLGQAPQQEFIFRDHHQYSQADLAPMRQAALPLVVTAKDAVKLLDLLPLPGLDVLVLQSRVSFGPGLFTSTSFPAWLENEINKNSRQ